MKRTMLVLLSLVFMLGCNLTANDNYLEDSWHTTKDGTFHGMNFGEKLIVTDITDGVRGTIVYDYYVSGEDIYILLGSNYVKTYQIVSISEDELELYSYIDGNSCTFKRS